MTSFRREYDERLPELDEAVKTMPGDIGEQVPGLTRESLRRFFQRLSIQLGRLDKRGAKHPQFLIWQGELVPEAIISNIDQAVRFLNAGAASFVQNSFSMYVSLEDALSRAVGVDADEIKALNSSVYADLRTAVIRSDEYIAKLSSALDDVTRIRQSVDATRVALDATAEKTTADAERITSVRRSVESMVNPDGRSRSSLESLVRKARERVSDVDVASEAVTKSRNDAAECLASILTDRDDAESALVLLRSMEKEAREILNLSSQAGLAASYTRESATLAKQSLIFTFTLYGTALLTALAAAWYVLPQLSAALSKVGSGVTILEAFSVTALRIAVLAPLVYVIYFSTRRVQTLELLRMDYAEKAAASLAYSGYREQMDTDDDLLRQLKSSLLIKFAEHPERLLRPGETTTSAKVKTAGFEAETVVGTKPAGEPAAD